MTFRERRQLAKFTQERLAYHVGVTRQTIVNIEQGKSAPNVYLAIDIADALGVAVEDLFPTTEAE